MPSVENPYLKDYIEAIKEDNSIQEAIQEAKWRIWNNEYLRRFKDEN